MTLKPALPFKPMPTQLLQGCRIVALLFGALITSGQQALAESGAHTVPMSQTGDDGQEFVPRVLKNARQTLGQSAVFGRWSDVVSWPLVAIHANLLSNGKVLAWDATPDDSDDDPHTTDSYTTRVTLWDPVSGQHVPTNNDTNSDLFCAGSAHLWDGRILFAGGDSGTSGANAPLENTSVYDPDTNTWRRVSNMATPRWYSSVAALANGEMLTFGGTYSPVPIAEVYQFDETWRPLSVTTPYEYPGDYQWLQATPEGNVISFGPQNTIATIDTEGSGLWTTGPQRDGEALRTYGSYAMYDVGKILVSGGGRLRSAVVIDTATQQTADTGTMNFARTQHNLTILADGSVLATGGNSDGTLLINPDAGVYRPEIWSPQTGQWSVMNDMQINRQYHSTALLLPDGRVLSAGGGICGDCYAVGYEESNSEVFSPPYLFSEGETLATRPLITSGPISIDYASDYNLTTEQSENITRIHLIKLGAATHSQNQDQRLVPLDYIQNGNLITISSPSTRDIAPPGHYLLFLVNDKGVPSNGEIMKVGQPLIESGRVVSNSIRRGESESFVIATSALDSSLIVRLSGLQSDTGLSLVNLTDAQAQSIRCEVTSGSRDTVECRLPNREASTWKIELDGKSDTPYKLVATVEKNTSSDFNLSLTVNGSVADRVTQDAWNFYSVTAPAGSQDLVISLSELTADADLYVREDSRPSGTAGNGGVFECASYRTERTKEDCHIGNAGGRTWLIGVFGSKSSNYLLSTTTNYTTPQAQPVSGGITRLTVIANQWKYFKLDGSSLTSSVGVQLSGLQGDADLYLRKGAIPERSVGQWGSYDCASYAGSTRDEYCAISNDGGDIYIGVYAQQSTTANLTIGSSSESNSGASGDAARVSKESILAFKNNSAEGGTVVTGSPYPPTSESIPGSDGDGTAEVRVGGGGSMGTLILTILGLVVCHRRRVLVW